MTHATTSPDTTTAGRGAGTIVLNLVLILLMPLFLAGADGDLALARRRL